MFNWNFRVWKASARRRDTGEAKGLRQWLVFGARKASE